MLEVTGLFCYPIKSCCQVALSRAEITSQGIRHDRQWMLVDTQSRFISQRECPSMGLITVTITEQGDIQAAAKGHGHVVFSADDFTGSMETQIWNDAVEAKQASQSLNQWFSAVLGMPCRLVHHGASSHRLIDPEHNPLNQTVAFADGFPLLVTHEATLGSLNQQLIAQNHPAVTMQRFRPNLVVKSNLPDQDEFQWSEIYSEQIHMLLPKLCSRCQITNLDPLTAEKTGNTVLSTLAKHHRVGNKAIFGVNAVVQKPGFLAVGDALHLVKQPSTE